MSALFVIAYEDLATADQVRDKLLSLNREHLVELEDVVVVERRASDGKRCTRTRRRRSPPDRGPSGHATARPSALPCEGRAVVCGDRDRIRTGVTRVAVEPLSLSGTRSCVVATSRP